MQEKTLFEGRFSKCNKLAIGVAILGVIILVVDFIISGGDLELLFGFGYGEFYALCLAVGCLVFAVVLYFMMRNCELIITDKKIYGQYTFGKRISLPLDMLSAVSIGFFKDLVVSTASGKISFWMITNGDDAWKIINDLIVNRQKRGDQE